MVPGVSAREFRENLNRAIGNRRGLKARLAVACRVSPQTISAWVRGPDVPQIDMLPVIARETGVQVEALVGGLDPDYDRVRMTLRDRLQDDAAVELAGGAGETSRVTETDRTRSDIVKALELIHDQEVLDELKRIVLRRALALAEQRQSSNEQKSTDPIPRQG